MIKCLIRVNSQSKCSSGICFGIYCGKECEWGWRTVEFDGEGITVKYYSPKSTIDINGEEYTNEAGTVSEVFIKNPLKDGEN